MAFIYTGFYSRNRINSCKYKIGMTMATDTPLSRIYANHLIDTGCVEIPNADEATMLLLESVARYTLAHHFGLKPDYDKKDWFRYERKTQNQYERVFDFADAVINAITEECTFRNIPYKIHLEGYTMAGKVARMTLEW